MPKTKELRASVKLPVLVLVIYILLAVTDSIGGVWGASQRDLLLSAIVIQILVFVLPTLFYTKLTHVPLTRKLGLRFFGPGRILLLVSMLGTMICGSLLVNMLCYAVAGRTGNFSPSSAYALSSQVGSINPNYVLLVFCLVPAVCEEFVFRGVILTGYSSESSAAGLLLSSLLFAMSHFNFVELPSYIFCGIVLGASAVITKSLYAPILLHFANNIFSIYAAPYIWTVVLEPRGPLFATVVIATLFLFCLIWMFRETEAAYYEYAFDPAYADPIVRVGGGGRLVRAAASPTLILCVLMFLVIALLAG